MPQANIILLALLELFGQQILVGKSIERNVRLTKKLLVTAPETFPLLTAGKSFKKSGDTSTPANTPWAINTHELWHL